MKIEMFTRLEDQYSIQHRGITITFILGLEQSHLSLEFQHLLLILFLGLEHSRIMAKEIWVQNSQTQGKIEDNRVTL